MLFSWSSTQHIVQQRVVQHATQLVSKHKMLSIKPLNTSYCPTQYAVKHTSQLANTKCCPINCLTRQVMKHAIQLANQWYMLPSRRSTQHNAQQSAQHVTQLAAQNNMLYISYAQHNIPPVIKCCGKCYTTGRQTRRTSHHAAQHNILPITICCGTYYPSCRPKTTYCSRENAQHDMLHNIMLIKIC